MDRPSRHILMVAPTSFFSDYGGHIRILEETLALQSLGQRVTIVTYYKGDDMPGLTIHRTPPLPWHAEYEVGSSRHKLAFDVYLAVKSLLVNLRVKPDIIHGHMHEGALIGGMLARLSGVPLVFDFQGGLTGEMIDHNFLDRNGRLYPWVHRVEKYICQMPQAILTSSLRAENLLAGEFGVPRRAIHPLPDCVDLNRFEPTKFSAESKLKLRRQLGIPDGRPVVAYLGLLADYQGTDHLVRAAAYLKQRGEDIHFLIMGFPRVQHYRAMADAMGVSDRIRFTDKVDYRQAPYYLSLGDVTVSAKMSATEGSGKVLNYMAMGQPVVAYDTPVHREYLAENGVYVSVGDFRGLADAVRDLIHDPERRICLGQKLWQRAAEKYSWQRAGEEICGLYEELLRGGR
ncbi:MAG: glycosyltransferase family 4 protein [Candidatus Promineifilaceae bacterium]